MFESSGKFNTNKVYTVRIGTNGELIREKKPDMDNLMLKKRVKITVEFGIIKINGILIPFIILNKANGKYSYFDENTGKEIKKYGGLRLKEFVLQNIEDGTVSI